MAELAGPIKIEGEYIKYPYFKERAEKKEGRGVNRTLPIFDMKARRKIGQVFQKLVGLLLEEKEKMITNKWMMRQRMRMI